MNELGLYFLQRDKKEGMRKEGGRKREIKKKIKANTKHCFLSNGLHGCSRRGATGLSDYRRQKTKSLLRTLHSAGHVPGQQLALQAACLVGLPQPHTGSGAAPLGRPPATPEAGWLFPSGAHHTLWLPPSFSVFLLY